MKQTVTISSSRDLQQFKRDFVELIDVVRNADGSYVLHLDIKRRSAASPSIISKADFDRVVSPAMHDEPAAFSSKVAGGRFLPDRLDRAYGAFAREQLRQQYASQHQRKILNRQEYIAYYYPDLKFYPKLAASLNKDYSVTTMRRP